MGNDSISSLNHRKRSRARGKSSIGNDEPIYSEQQRSYFIVESIDIDDDEFKDIMNEINNDEKSQSAEPEPAFHKKKSMLTADNIIDDISDRFIYIKQLGKGASCRVLLCKEKSSKKLYALKEL